MKQKEIKITKSLRFNIVRSEMTKTGALIGGRLIAGDKEYDSFDEAIEKATEYFISEGAPKGVEYNIIGGVTREYYVYAMHTIASVKLAYFRNKQVEGEVLVATFPSELSFATDKRGYPINFMNQEENLKPFVHPNMNKDA